MGAQKSFPFAMSTWGSHIPFGRPSRKLRIGPPFWPSGTLWERQHSPAGAAPLRPFGRTRASANEHNRGAPQTTRGNRPAQITHPFGRGEYGPRPNSLGGGGRTNNLFGGPSPSSSLFSPPYFFSFADRPPNPPHETPATAEPQPTTARTTRQHEHDDTRAPDTPPEHHR